MVQVRSRDHSYLQEFESFQSGEDDGTASWLKSLRREAFRDFETLGFPTLRDEDWKYTNVAAIARQNFSLASGLGEHSQTTPGFPGLIFSGGRCLDINETDKALPNSVEVSALASVLRDQPELVKRHLSERSVPYSNGFEALNAAFLHDGGVVRIPAGVKVETPILLSFYAEDRAVPSMAHPHNLIILEPGARVSVVEQYGSGQGANLTNAVTEIVIGEGARLDYCKVQTEGAGAYHVGTTNVILGRNSEFSSFTLDLGARIGRNDLSVTLDGDGAFCEMNGLYIASGSSHIDNHTSVDHEGSFTPSRQLYKGVLAGNARAVFNGKIIARRGTHQVDAHQTNNNLLLSDKAMVDTKPQLEIFADDLKCSHGATVGQLDEEAIFYLASRGIGPGEARRILTSGFAKAVVGKVTDLRVRDYLIALVDEKLISCANAGAFEETR